MPSTKPLTVKENIPKTGFYSTAFNMTVLITGLGYFVDTFDFFLYNSMRVVSLTELGLSGAALTKTGIIILNCQIFGALLGSFFWGILGDKLGRKKPLLASILVYSVFMIANAFVTNEFIYAVVRFIIGFGVAGEVGLGATLVAETIKSSKRTYAMMFFTIMGVIGVVVAGLSLELVTWRASCFIGGIIGLLLLTLRSVIYESPLFIEKTQIKTERGSLRALFGKIENLKKYILCVPLLGCNFFVTGVLLTLAPEVAKAGGVQGIVKANIALSIYFLTAVLGDCLGAWLSEIFKSRRLVTAIFICGNLLLAVLLLHILKPTNVLFFYFICGSFGLFNLWALTATIVVEQFPTELRATASTSSFNCSRAMVILMNLSLLALISIGTPNGILIIGAIVFLIALFCIWRLPETYGKVLTE
jgi:MFS family permease